MWLVSVTRPARRPAKMPRRRRTGRSRCAASAWRVASPAQRASSFDRAAAQAGGGCPESEPPRQHALGACEVLERLAQRLMQRQASMGLLGGLPV